MPGHDRHGAAVGLADQLIGPSLKPAERRRRARRPAVGLADQLIGPSLKLEVGLAVAGAPPGLADQLIGPSLKPVGPRQDDLGEHVWPIN